MMKRLPLLLVLAACLFTGVVHRSELTVRAPEVNDAVFHLGLIQRMDDTWRAGGNPLDPWVPYWGQGFPVLRYYQHLPHLAVVLVHRLLPLSLPDAYHSLLWLCLTLLPLSFYWGARKLGFAPEVAALAALCAPLVGADPSQKMLFGFQPNTFIWMGPGLFTQLFAMMFFAPAVGAVQETALTGRKWGPSLALLWATWLSHLLLGYSVCLLGLAALARPEAKGQRRAVVRRIAALYALGALSILHMILPAVMERHYLGHSIWEDAAYWDSFGAGPVIRMFCDGGLLDGDRWPVLTLLAFAGLIVAALRWSRDAPARAALAGFALAMLLFFGRPFWGALTMLLPFSGSLPLHRFICAVQYGGVLLAAVALSELWRRLRWGADRRRAALCVAATLLVLAPAVMSTAKRAGDDARARMASADNFALNMSDFDGVMERFVALDREAPGRAYAGASWNWGRDYKLGSVPMYMYWSGRGLPSISYMFHGMSLNSDLEPLFDEKRLDHYQLFNVRHLMVFNRSYLPPFAQVFAERPGIVAANVDTPGMFEVVGVTRSLDASAMTPKEWYDFNQRFISSAWHGAGQYLRVLREGGAAPEPAVLPSERFDAAPPPRPPGRVLRWSGHDDRFGAELDAGAPAWVVFRMTWHPSWRVTVDGAATPTAMLSPSFVGFQVAPGRHRVEVVYDPGRWTLWLFLLEQLLVGAAFAFDRLRRAPSTPRAWKSPPAWLLLAIIPVVHLPYLVHWKTGFTSDNAIPYLMARHIDDHPLFYWGQSYFGALEAWLGAALMRLHDAPWIVDLVPLAAYVATAGLVVWRAPPEKRRRLAFLFVCFPPSLYVATARPGFSQGTFLWLGWAGLIALRPGLDDDPLRRAAFLRAGAAGLVLALAAWYMPTAMVALAALALLAAQAAARDGSAARRAARAAQMALVGAVGFLGVWVMRLAPDLPTQARLELTPFGQLPLKLRLLGQSFLQFAPTFRMGPATTGFNSFYSGLPIVAQLDLDTVPQTEDVLTVALALGMAVLCIRGALQRRVSLETAFWRLLLLGIVAAFVGSSLAGELGAARYLTPAFVPLVVLACEGLRALPERLLPALAVAWAAAALSGHAHALTADDAVNRDLDAAVAVLDDHAVDGGTADYWLAYNLTARTRERMTFAPLESRYPPYLKKIASMRRTATLTFWRSQKQPLLPAADLVREAERIIGELKVVVFRFR
jgi:hypothetical protein